MEGPVLCALLCHLLRLYYTKGSFLPSLLNSMQCRRRAEKVSFVHTPPHFSESNSWSHCQKEVKTSTGITKSGLMFSLVRIFRSRCFRVRHITCLTAKTESAKELGNLWDLRLICFDLLHVAPGRNTDPAIIIPGVSWCICTCAREKEHLNTGWLDLGRMDGSLMVCELGFAQCPHFCSRHWERLNVLSAVQSKGRGWDESGTSAWHWAWAGRGGMRNVRAANSRARAQGFLWGDYMSISRWTLWENKTQRAVLCVCVLLQRGDASRARAVIWCTEQWEQRQAPDPAPSRELAVFLEGPLNLFPLCVCTRDKRDRDWDPFV